MKPKIKKLHQEVTPEHVMGHVARTLWDIQRTRIMMNNRVKGMERDGFPKVVQAPIIEAHDRLVDAETDTNKKLEIHAKEHFMADWIESQRGIGYGGFARIVGVTGDLTRFATVSKLWRYMGMAVDAGQAPKRRRGEKVNYSPQGRTVCHQIADAMVKSGGPWRAIYDQKRSEYLARPRLGPSACPFNQIHKAEEKYHDDTLDWERKTGAKKTIQCVKIDDETGKEISAHVHNAAMRYMIKMFLKELWVEWHARRDLTLTEPHGRTVASAVG